MNPVIQQVLDGFNELDPDGNFDQQRLAANRDLVQLLCGLVEDNPSLRFGQILANFGFIDRHQQHDSYGCFYNFVRDEIQTEPMVILNRVKKTILEDADEKILNNQ